MSTENFNAESEQAPENFINQLSPEGLTKAGHAYEAMLGEPLVAIVAESLPDQETI